LTTCHRRQTARESPKSPINERQLHTFNISTNFETFAQDSTRHKTNRNPYPQSLIAASAHRQHQGENPIPASIAFLVVCFLGRFHFDNIGLAPHSPISLAGLPIGTPASLTANVPKHLAASSGTGDITPTSRCLLHNLLWPFDIQQSFCCTCANRHYV
jgi:hypothetical protein